MPITLQRIFCANRKHSSGQACRLARLALLPHLLSYLVAIHTFCRTLLLLRLVVRCCYTPFVVSCCYTPFAVPCCYTPFVVPCCCYTLSYVVAIRLLSYLVAVPFALAYLPYLDMLPGCIRNRKGGLFCIQEWASYDLRYQLQCNSMGNMHGHHMTIAIIYHLS